MYFTQSPISTKCEQHTVTFRGIHTIVILKYYNPSV